VGSFVKNWPGHAIGVIGAPGDRRDEDFVALGHLAADIFDQVVIKEDDDTRGRASGEVADFILEGIKQVEKATEEAFSYQVQLNETEAVNWALDNASEGSLVVVLPESVSRAISLISARGPVSEGFSLSGTQASETPIVFKPVEGSSAENDLATVVTAADVQSLNGASATPSLP